jgi:hypothetical protein
VVNLHFDNGAVGKEMKQNIQQVVNVNIGEKQKGDAES